MVSGRDLIEFVISSDNRLGTLRALTNGPASRPELQDETGIARSTLSRILADYQDFGFVEKNRHSFSLTPLGEHVVTQLDMVIDSIDRMQTVQSVSQWLPIDEDLPDLTTLDAVTVTLPSQFDPMAPVKRAAAVIENAETIRTFCYSVLHAPILAEAQNVIDNGHRFVAVVASGVLEVVASDPELRTRVLDIVESGQSELFIYHGSIEPQLIIAGDTVMFLVADDEGAIQGLIEITDPEILPWAEDVFNSIKADADPLDTDRITELLTL